MMSSDCGSLEPRSRSRRGARQPGPGARESRADGRIAPPAYPWIIAGVLAFLAILLTFDPKLYINGDNVDYMNLARGVRQGHFWSSDKYPPLFPMILAPVQALFGMNLFPQKMLVTLLAGGSIWMLAGILRRRTGSRSGPWLLFLAATLIPFVEYGHYVMSEVPFAFFLLGAIASCDRLREGGFGRPWSRRVIAPALWIGAAFYIRSAGVAVAGGVLLWLLLERRSRHALALSGLLALVAVPWIVHSAMAPGGSPYLHQLMQVNPYYPEFGLVTPAGLAARIVENARTYLLGLVPATAVPAMYASTYSPPVLQKAYYPVLIAVPLLIPFGAGLWRGLVRRTGRPVPREVRRVSPAGSDPMTCVVSDPVVRVVADPMVCVVVVSLALLCLWPVIWSASRFLVPIAPLLLVIWWSGWRLPDEIGWRGPWRWIRGVFLVAFLVFGVRNLIFYAQETRTYPPEWGNYFASLVWIRDHAAPDAVIVDRKPGIAEFVTGRRAVSFPRESDPHRMVAYFREQGVTHVVVPELPYDDIDRYLRPVIATEQPLFRLLCRTPPPAAAVYEFQLAQGAQGASPADSMRP